MKKIYLLLFTLPFLFFLMTGCDSTNPEDQLTEAQTVNLYGQVVNADTYDPIENAVVAILEYSQNSTSTDQEGYFNLTVELEKAEHIHIVTYRNTYIEDTLLVYAAPGEDVNDITVELAPTLQTVVPSGDAASIVFGNVDPTSIGVRESGSKEVAMISFIVQDSTGLPVDAEHAVNVNFTLGASPGGGLFMSPASGVTRVGGVVTTYLFSGDSAGVVQIIATVDLPGKTILSKPVSIAIHGGFPHQDHLGLGFEKINIPGLVRYGEATSITAFVGDIYGNPVRTGTSVYFTTSGGIVEGSALTDDLGTASVTIISAEPLPWSNGFSTVTARTADQNEDMIEVSGQILFSGTPIITISPTTFALSNGGSQVFNFRICDLNGNPMSSGQKITVTAQGGIVAAGDINLTMDDTQSQASTYFSFAITDSDPDKIEPVNAVVSISTSGPNNKASVIISGSAE